MTTANDTDGGGPTVGSRLRRFVSPAACWTALGLAFTIVQLVILSRWIAAGPKSVPVDADTIPTYIKVSAWIIQGLLLTLLIYTVIKVVRECLRETRLTVNAAIAIAMISIAVLDPMMNSTPTQAIGYNPYYLNFATWGPWIPGWHGSNPELQAVPIWVAFGYLFALPFAWTTISTMRKIKGSESKISSPRFVILGGLAAMLLDFVGEIGTMRLGTHVYPHAVPGISLFYGSWHQFCLNVGFFTLIFMAIIALMLRTDADGRTFVERGFKARTSGRQAGIRIFAIIGYLNVVYVVFLMAIVLTNVLWGGPLPPDTPSYFHLR